MSEYPQSGGVTSDGSFSQVTPIPMIGDRTPRAITDRARSSHRLRSGTQETPGSRRVLTDLMRKLRLKNSKRPFDNEIFVMLKSMRAPRNTSKK